MGVIQGTQSVMLSRVANSIYWMNRYIERAENYSRFIDVNLNLTLDLSEGTAEQWEPLVLITGDQEVFKARRTDATMSHGEGWHFGRLGRLIERADKTSRILDVKYFFLLPSVADVGTSLDNIQWAALLKSASALQMYRKRYGRISPKEVAEFLILDSEFPRAIHYCLIKAEESLHAISGSEIGRFENLAEKRLGRLRPELAYANIEEIMAGGLHEFLDSFQTKLNCVGDGIAETFFTFRQVEDMVSRERSDS
mgnify:CR=1 FL=1